MDILLLLKSTSIWIFMMMQEQVRVSPNTTLQKFLSFPSMLTFFFILHLCSPGSVLCVGSEWHRFPSSFFIPDYIGEVRWIDDGFRGLLPFPFNSTLGGTAAAPPYFNNKNKASDMQYVITCWWFRFAYPVIGFFISYVILFSQSFYNFSRHYLTLSGFVFWSFCSFMI